MDKPLNVHGTGVLLGQIGVLLRGPSGAGKSLLALSLLDRWESRGEPAFLVADDRVDISAGAGQLVMSGNPSLAGMIELRGRGIVRRPYQHNVPLHLVIDLVPDLVRMLEEEDIRAELAGVPVARAPVPTGTLIGLGHQMLLVQEAMAELAQA
jgi:serine kinase of HPr protein (carbohydrate metabolism regulator)